MVLYNLDLGALYHYSGQADSSNKYLFAAEKEIEDLYTESVSLNVLSYVLNDNVLPYEGEDFEKVLVNVFLALNYACVGLSEDALVEARKVDLKLREYARRYEEKNTYKEDAFVRYIAGVLYENEGDINDAFVSYRKAYETYEIYAREYGTTAPRFLVDDLVRTASRLSFADEVRKYEELGGARVGGAGGREGSVLVVVYSGRGPVKIENRPTVTIPDTSGTLHTFQIALPRFLPRQSVSRTYTVAATSDNHIIESAAETAENITAIAQKCLEDRLGLIYLKSGGRALAKFLASEKAKKDIAKDSDSKTKNILASVAIDLLVGATEQADTRTWRTLPAEIQIARLSLSPGRYRLSVRASDANADLKDVQVNVQSGRASFVLVDDLR
jgi:hypothetical protein